MSCSMATRCASLFWLSAGLLAYAQAGYALVLALLERAGGAPVRARRPPPGGGAATCRSIVAAYREEAVIAAKVANALALDWPRERLEIVVAVDGGAEPGADATAARAREAGADVVLELPRGGKMRSQDAAVRGGARASCWPSRDANAMWAPDALRELAAAFADPEVAYACGQVAFVNEAGTNQEGLYWRYEMAIRARESALASVTGGNGAIYAVRREDYLSRTSRWATTSFMPFSQVKRGRRAVYVPAARGDGEDGAHRRGRVGPQAADDDPGVADRPARRAGRPARLPAALRLDGRLAPAAALRLAAAARARARREPGPVAPAPVPRGGARPAGARGGRAGRRARCASRPLLVARYYVLTTASLAAGLHDHLRHGTPQGWEPAEGTR